MHSSSSSSNNNDNNNKDTDFNHRLDGNCRIDIGAGRTIRRQQAGEMYQCNRDTISSGECGLLTPEARARLVEGPQSEQVGADFELAQGRDAAQHHRCDDDARGRRNDDALVESYSTRGDKIMRSPIDRLPLLTHQIGGTDLGERPNGSVGRSLASSTKRPLSANIEGCNFEWKSAGELRHLSEKNLAHKSIGGGGGGSGDDDECNFGKAPQAARNKHQNEPASLGGLKVELEPTFGSLLRRASQLNAFPRSLSTRTNLVSRDSRSLKSSTEPQLNTSQQTISTTIKNIFTVLRYGRKSSKKSCNNFGHNYDDKSENSTDLHSKVKACGQTHRTVGLRVVRSGGGGGDGDDSIVGRQDVDANNTSQQQFETNNNPKQNCPKLNKTTTYEDVSVSSDSYFYQANNFNKLTRNHSNLKHSHKRNKINSANSNSNNNNNNKSIIDKPDKKSGERVEIDPSSSSEQVNEANRESASYVTSSDNNFNNTTDKTNTNRRQQTSDGNSFQQDISTTDIYDHSSTSSQQQDSYYSNNNKSQQQQQPTQSQSQSQLEADRRHRLDLDEPKSHSTFGSSFAGFINCSDITSLFSSNNAINPFDSNFNNSSDKDQPVTMAATRRQPEQTTTTSLRLEPHQQATFEAAGDAGSPSSEPQHVNLKIDQTESESDDEGLEKRDVWDKNIEFLLAVIGFAVDLGNVWRFPYVCYKNGGGAFLIPYTIMFVLGGLPIFYMEMSLGQYFSSGCLTVWRRVCPLAKGIGYAMCVLNFFTGLYYNTIISWAVFFFVESFTLDLPWTSCDNPWNSPDCKTIGQRQASRTFISDSSFSASSLDDHLNHTQAIHFSTPTKDYFENEVLRRNLSTGINDLGSIRKPLAVYLAIVFILIYFAIWKGVKSTGKAVWITALLPYFVLIPLLIRGVFLEGAWEGIRYYLYPQWYRVTDVNVWVEAAKQIYFSLGPGFGTLMALSSYNKFTHNSCKDALIAASVNYFASFISGFVIFAVLGYMATIEGVSVNDVAREGPGLVFQVYPEGLATMQFSSMWSILFFIMVITLGIDSTFGGLESVITGLCDEYPRVLRAHRGIFIGILIIVIYLCSLPTTTYGGNYVIYLLESYGTSLSLLFIVLIETVIVCWLYGVERFCANLTEMNGYPPAAYWRICWKYISPTILLLIFFAACLQEFDKYHILSDGEYTYPGWAPRVGLLMTGSSVMCIPIYAIYYLKFKTTGPFLERLKTAIRPLEQACANEKRMNAASRSDKMIGQNDIHLNSSL